MIILWPIGGKGVRFKKNDYLKPKPFIDIKNKPMIEYALSSISFDAKHYVICNTLDKIFKDKIYEIGNTYKIDIELVEINQETRGQAETSFIGLNEIEFNQDEELIISNCDQYTPWSKDSFLELVSRKDVDAAVTTYNHGDFDIGKSSPYSHVELNEKGFAVKFAEKYAISEHSLNGIYYWKKIKYFTDSFQDLDKSDFNGEYWLSLTFNYMIENGLKIKTFQMDKDEFYSLGTPEDIQKNIEMLN